MPRSLNRCTFIGRLANNPTPGTAPDGVAATTMFILAVPDSDTQSTLIPVTAIGRVADVCNRILREDTEVYIEGKYHTRRSQIGDVLTIITEVQLENMQLLGKK
jgi:single-stranded DNA-binding protein